MIFYVLIQYKFLSYSYNLGEIELNTKKKIKQIEEYMDKDDIIVSDYVTNDGIDSVAVNINGYVYKLTTSLNLKEDVDIWFEKYRNKNAYSVFVFFGIANGIYLEKIIDNYPNAIFIVYEPCTNVLKKYINRTEKREIIEKDEVYLCAGEKGKELFYSILEGNINTRTINVVNWITLPGYEYIYMREHLDIYRQFSYFMNEAKMGSNTKKTFGRQWPKCYLKCVPDMLKQYSVEDLTSLVRAQNDRNRVAIIVAAGPSLDDNIDDLKAYRERALVIAADTALKPLKRHGIIPDILVSIDSDKPKAFFDTPEFKSIPLVLESNSNAELIKLHNSKRFYASTGEAFTDSFMSLIDKKMGAILTGGSVGTSAFYLALMMGFKKVILVGHDLAMTGGKIHSNGVHEKEEDNIADKPGIYMDVEGLHGGKVRTRGDYNNYRKWFEFQISMLKDVEVINSTYDGAKIRGAKEMTFKDALELWCNKSDRIDYSSLINSVKHVCDQNEIIVIEKYFRSLPDKLKRYRRRLNKGIAYYNKLDKLKSQGEETGQEFRDIFKEIKKTNKWLDHIKEKSLLEMYQADLEYEIERSTYDVKQDETEEWKASIDLGIRTYQMYIYRINDFLEDYYLLYETNK